jgi:outer membrane protein TolC
MSFRNAKILVLPLVVLGVVAACAPSPEVASIDTADRRFYASQGQDPVIGDRLEAADAMAAASPTHRVQTRRLSQAVSKSAADPLLMPPLPVPEITGMGVTLRDAGPLPEAARVPESDISLPGLIALTLNHNGEIARAAESVTAADIAAVNAVFAYLPRVSSVGEWTRVYQDVIDSDNEVFREGDANFPVLNIQTEIRQPILDFPRIFGMRRADTGRSVARAAYLGVAQGTVFNVVNTYVNALDYKHRLASVEQRILLLDRQIAAELRLLETGRSTPAAAQLLEIEQGSAALERTEFAENYAMALAELSRLVGRQVPDVADFALPDEVWEQAGRGPLDDYLLAALKDNPLVKQRRIESLERRQVYEESLLVDFAPTLEGFARQEYEDRDASRFGGGSRTLDHTIGLQLTVPIFNVRGEGYRSREQLSELRQAVIGEAQLRRELEGEIPSLLMRLNAQRQSMRNAEAAVAAAERLVASAEVGVQAGINPEFMVTMQELQLERAREWADRTRYAFVRSWVRLAYLTGSDAFIRIDDEPGGEGREMARVVWLDEWQAQIGQGHDIAQQEVAPPDQHLAERLPATAAVAAQRPARANPHGFLDEIRAARERAPAPILAEAGPLDADLVEPAAGAAAAAPGAPTQLFAPLAVQETME